jgi:hypothetical protein
MTERAAVDGTVLKDIEQDAQPISHWAIQNPTELAISGTLHAIVHRKCP